MDLVTPHFGLLFWQTITFLVLLFVLSKFAWRPITAALREREHSIDQALSAAENAKAEVANLKASNEKFLQEARLERDKIIKDAQAASASMIAEAKDKAAAEGARQLEAARLSIETAKQAAISELKNQSAALAIQIAERLIKKELSSDAAQSGLVEEYMKEVNLN